MKMKFVHTCHYSLLLLALVLSFRQFRAQQQSLAPPYSGPNKGTADLKADLEGFISLDCGLEDRNGYADPSTNLSYTSDDNYVEDGTGNKGQSISSAYQTTSLPRQYNYVRSFPGPVGTRGCYSLPLSRGKEYQILLRLGFMYGNYDGKNTPPQFDLYLGANHWETVQFTDSDHSYFFVTEVIHKPASDSLHLCLVNTGNGTPFISLIELRPMNLSAYNTSSGSLKFFSRFDMGSSERIRELAACNSDSCT